MTSSQNLELLRTVHRITHASDEPSLIHCVTQAIHALPGFERVRFYVGSTSDKLIQLRSAIGVDDEDAQEPPLRLSAANLLGRAALTPGSPHVWRVASLEDADEDPNGLPTCLVAIALPRGSIGVVVADNPHSTAMIPPQTIQSLDLLTEFAACSIAYPSRGRMGGEFVSKVSHELRTPLTSIRAFTEMLLDGDAGELNEKQQRYVTRVDKGAAMLLRVVEDLLELTHLEFSNRPVEETSIALKPFLDDVAFNLTPQADAKQISMRTEAQDDLPTLTTDQQRLQQAVTNLVENAIKYSPEGSLVRLVATQSPQGLRLAVVDDGPGIRPEEQEKIFDTFYRAYEGQASLENKGSGLGLSIVRSLARMLGAVLQLESEPGKGSTFALIFPMEG